MVHIFKRTGYLKMKIFHLRFLTPEAKKGCFVYCSFACQYPRCTSSPQRFELETLESHL